jgi:large subunit ribosomal protein L19
MKLLDELAKASLRTDIPDFKVGDTVEISVKVVEGDKEKIHEFKGVVIARKGRGISETFIVRKLSFGEGIERIFYLNSPMIKAINVTKRGKVRKAKLYYLRGKIGKKSKVKELELVPDTSPKTVAVEEKAETKAE